jgi:hypothetical protein
MEQSVRLVIARQERGPKTSLIISCSSSPIDVRLFAPNGRYCIAKNTIKPWQSETLLTLKQFQPTQVESDHDPVRIEFEYLSGVASVTIEGTLRVIVGSDSNEVTVFGRGKVIAQHGCRVVWK